MKLNNNQKDAIKHGGGPLLIIAGAGTGKTTVITERIKFLISKGLAKPEEILALTFTEKAASEMEGRIDEIMPLSYGDLWISTFHSFCDQILRESGIHIGLSSKYKLMTQAQCIDLIRKNLFDFNLDYFRPLGNPNKFIDGLLQHFSRLQDELISVDDYLNYSKKFKSDEPLEVKKTNELVSAYKTYNELKLRENVMDFADLITYTVKLFKDRPNILKIYQEKFKYVLVDEFQDTNFAQNELVNLLASKNKNITVVGDDNQSIYRFRGAAISNIIQFKNTYKNAKVITLNQNYRSIQSILDGAYKLIKHNNPDTLEYRLGISKKLKAISHKPYGIKHIATRTGDEEAEAVVKEIIQLTDQKKYKYGDIAILVRANNHAEAFIREFERQGIPYQFLGPQKLFEKEEIVDLISYLKVIYNPGDSSSLYRLLSSDILGFEISDLHKLFIKSKKESKEILDLIFKEEKFEKITKLIKRHINEITKKSAGEILYEYIKEIGLLNKLIDEEEDIKAKNISKFFERIKKYEDSQGNKKVNIYELVDYINLLIEVGDVPIVDNNDWQNQDAVSILTVHSSKGLEFPVVFLVNLVNERFPSRERGDQIPIPAELIKEELPLGDFHLQEERRLFYVGMTRAKERLYFSTAKYYGDGKREKKISPFVYESLGENYKLQIPIPKQISINSYQISKQRTHNPQPTTDQLKIDYLSVSQIESFKTCPMHYKLRYIYKIPTPPSASISFGVSIHETLKDLFTKENAKKINTKWLLEQFKNNFIEQGYENRKHKEKFFEKGKDYLNGFLEVSFDPKVKTLDLEKKFTIKLAKNLKIGGTIDRIDDLGGGLYEIIDYKTGASIPTQREVDKDLQLSVYAMAVSEIYKVKPENIKLSLYYLDNQEKLSTKRTKEDLEKVKKEILGVRDQIEMSDFKCSGNYFCQQGCEFSMFCRSTTNQ